MDSLSLNDALKYADNGWNVFPLHGIVNGQCTCGMKCASPGKHPLTKNGLKDATTDSELITRWFTRFPQANVAIATGPESDLWVVDVDNKQSIEIGNRVVPQGSYSIQELEQEHDAIPDGRMVETGGGGLHYYFRWSDGCGGNRAGIRPGLDVRGDGGYVVAPPSRHLSGHTYQWGNEDILPDAPPVWLVQAASSTHASLTDIGQDDVVVEGGRNSYLHDLGAKYRREHGYLDWQLYGLLQAHNHHQCSPPIDDTEVRRIAGNVSKYDYDPDVDLSQWSRTDIPIIPEGGDLAVSIEQLLLHPPVPPLPLVHGLMSVGTGVLIGGQPNVGKSWLVMDMAVAIATGEPWLDSFATEKGPVLMIDEEGTEYGQYERFQMLFDGRSYLSPIGVQLHVAIGTGLRLDSDVGITRVRRMLERYRPRIVILDSLVRLHSGDENSAKSMANFFEITKGLMRTYETTFLFTHHVRKPSLDSNDPGDLLRGTSEIRAWPDTIFVATPDADDQQAIIMHHVKARWGKRMSPFKIIMQIDDESGTARIVYAGEVEPNERSSVNSQNRVLKAIQDLNEAGEDADVGAISEMVKRSERTTREYLSGLVRIGALDAIESRGPGNRAKLVYRIKGTA